MTENSHRRGLACQRELLTILLILGVWVLDHRRAEAAPGSSLLKEAQTAYQAKDYNKTITILSPKLETIPREGYVLLANAYRESNNAMMSVKTLTTAQGKFPADDEIETALGLAHLSNNKEREAKATLKEVLDRNPKYEPAYLALVELYQKKGNRYELRIIFQDLVEHIGRKPLYLQNLCELYTRDGIYDLAKASCNEAISMNPKEPMNYVNLATMFSHTGKTPEADTTFKKVADSFSKSEPAQFAYGQFLDEQKKYVDAFKYYKRGAEADGKAARCWQGMAFAAIESQKFQESLNAFEKLCVVDNRSAIKHSRRAAGIVMKLNQPVWLRKFQDMVDKCEGSPKNFY